MHVRAITHCSCDIYHRWFCFSKHICCRAKLQLASVEESGSQELELAANLHESQEALHLEYTDTQQLQTTLTDKELQLAAVTQHAEQLLVQVTELQSSAEKTQLSLQSEQQSSSAAAQCSSQLEQQLLTSQGSLQQLQEQLDASTQSAASAVLSLQGKLLCNKSHPASSCLLLLLLESHQILVQVSWLPGSLRLKQQLQQQQRLALSYRSSKGMFRACSPISAKHSRPSRTSNITRLLHSRKLCQMRPI